MATGLSDETDAAVRHAIAELERHVRLEAEPHPEGGPSQSHQGGSPSSPPQFGARTPRRWSPLQALAAAVVLAVAVVAGLTVYHHVARPTLPPPPLSPIFRTPGSAVPGFNVPPPGTPSFGQANERTYVADCEGTNPDALTVSDPVAFCQCIYNNIVAQSPSRLVARQLIASERDPSGVETFMAETSCIGMP